MNYNLKNFGYFFTFLLFVFVLGACSGLFNSDSNGPDLSFETTAVEGDTTIFNGDTLVFRSGNDSLSLATSEYPEFTAHTDEQTIVINGYYISALGIPSATFDREGNTITIRVYRENKTTDRVVPSMSAGILLYDAYLGNLSEGTYTVQIDHRDDIWRTEDGLTWGGEFHTVFTDEFVVE